jgi:hypothetical protein
VNDAKEEKFTTPKIIRNELEINNISVHTIRRTLDENKLHGRIAKSEYLYTSQQLIKRLSFGNGYADRTNWNDVLFSDEKTFSLCKYTSQQWVQIPEGISPYNPEYMIHKQSHSDKLHM